MSVRRFALGGILLISVACGPGAQSPMAPSDPEEPLVPVQAGPPPAGTNNDPTVMITAPADGATVMAGSTVNLSADLTDPDVGDSHTCYVDWQLAAGPGTVTESGGAGTCTASNSYTVPGDYLITVAVIDPMGGTAMDSIMVTVATSPPPPPPPPAPGPQAGSIRAAGRLPMGTAAVAGFSGRDAAIFFDLNAKATKDGAKVKGTFGVQVPKARLTIVSTVLTKLDLVGARADVSGTGKLNGRRRVWFAVAAVDGNRGERAAGTDRIRIKVWDELGVVFDTDPGLPNAGDPTAVPKPGRIVIKP